MEKTTKEKRSIQAMAFYHNKGLVPAIKQAMMFAGKDGRIATMPDIINAKIATNAGAVPWETYFTTLSAEYVGIGQDGKKKIIVAHGVGPMSTLDGILKAYGFEYNDKTRACSGGRISREEFFKLENGKYGPVSVLGFDDVVKRYEYPFLGVLDFKSAAKDPLLKARLGENYNKYLLKHRDIANQWLSTRKKNTSFNPFIIENSDASNCSYMYNGGLEINGTKQITMANDAYDKNITDNWALAHLLSMGQLMNLGHQKSQDRSLVCDFSCHEWGNGVRFVAIRDDKPITDIHEGFDAQTALRKSWPQLMRPAKTPAYPGGLRAMVQLGDNWFTQYPKKGESMDTYEPEFHIESFEDIGEPVTFRTKIGGYHMFVRYGIKEVERIAPIGANAYRKAGEPKIIWTEGDPQFHEITVQFCHAKIDFSRRLIRSDAMINDFDLMMSLVD